MIGKKFLILGAGKMATALAAGAIRSGLFPAEAITASDPLEAARNHFTQTTGACTVAALTAELLADADYLLVAVKPQVAQKALEVLPEIPAKTLLISICAGIPIAKISAWSRCSRVIRVMPNTPLMVGCGASCFAPAPQATEADCGFVQELLGKAGIAEQVTEEQLDAVTALSGSGPAYLFEMAKAMSLAGEKIGLSPELSLELTVQTLLGAAEMLHGKMGTPDELRDAVTSPHGTTFEALEVMRKHDFRSMMKEAILAAKNRSQELGRG